jgi:hypothetical protein
LGFYQFIDAAIYSFIDKIEPVSITVVSPVKWAKKHHPICFVCSGVKPTLRSHILEYFCVYMLQTTGENVLKVKYQTNIF